MSVNNEHGINCDGCAQLTAIREAERKAAKRAWDEGARAAMAWWQSDLTSGRPINPYGGQEISAGPGTMLELINAAISLGAKAGDVLTIEDGDGNSQTVTLGETTSASGRKTLVAVAVEVS